MKRVAIWAMANQGVWVKDYIKIIDGVRKWTLIHSSILEIESQFQIIGKEIELSMFDNINEEDSIKCSLVKNGKFSIKEVVYYLSDNRNIFGLWEKVWVKGLIPKISFFPWIVAHEVILTQDKLQNRGFQLANMCVLYKKKD